MMWMEVGAGFLRRPIKRASGACFADVELLWHLFVRSMERVHTPEGVLRVGNCTYAWHFGRQPFLLKCFGLCRIQKNADASVTELLLHYLRLLELERSEAMRFSQFSIELCDRLRTRVADVRMPSIDAHAHQMFPGSMMTGHDPPHQQS